MKMPSHIRDSDIRGSWPALQRAASAARRLALQTRTPLYVWRNGRVVNLVSLRRKRRPSAA